MFDDLDKLDKLQKQAQKSEPVDNGKRGINLLPTDLRRSEKSKPKPKFKLTKADLHPASSKVQVHPFEAF